MKKSIEVQYRYTNPIRVIVTVVLLLDMLCMQECCI